MVAFLQNKLGKTSSALAHEQTFIDFPCSKASHCAVVVGFVLIFMTKKGAKKFKVTDAVVDRMQLAFQNGKPTAAMVARQVRDITRRRSWCLVGGG